MQTQNLIDRIFTESSQKFNTIAAEVFAFQQANNLVYNKWCSHFKIDLANEFNITSVPFLPISFFKTHKIVSANKAEQQIFESSGTTNTVNSKHFVTDISVYKESFTKAFEATYGSIKDWCFIGLLPSYLERNNSSLVFMVDELIKQSSVKESGFYLYDFAFLQQTLHQLESKNQKTILIGVTFALLDFAEQFPTKLQSTIIMETGGMKGRKKEMTKEEVYDALKTAFGVNEIHSEYGMTELLSQAYSTKDQIHICPPWMKVFVRDEEDPFNIKTSGRGVINIVDLANINSCSFIATDDVGEVFEDGSFKIFGRLDNSDLRGCSLLYI